MSTISSRRGALAALVAIACVGVTGFAAPAPAGAAEPGACQSLYVPVKLSPDSATTYKVYAELCGAAPGRTVQLLVSGATYGHVYWDFPMQPETYSYVRAMNAGGYATLNVDRIGIGRSDHPAAAQVTVGSSAYVLHQLIGKLRGGEIGGVGFGKVVIVGHSLGSIMAMTEAGKYHDVDAAILTGISHDFVTTNTAVLFGTLVPTQLDPILSSRRLPLGYLTTLKGIRETDFYYPPTTDPAVVAYDEKTKETVTATELGTVADAYLYSESIGVPVLEIDGSRDQLVCGPAGAATPCDGAINNLLIEKAWFPRANPFTVELVADTGHDLPLHTTAPVFFSDVKRWTDTYVGSGP